jgi:outer membrane receptor protein involved in Fe transport
LIARFLDDRMYAGQVDLTIPFKLRRSEDSNLKIGVMRRLKNRVFTSDPYTWVFPGAPPSITSLPPEQALSPENLGKAVVELRGSVFSNEPYITHDTVSAAYGMLDLSPARWVRIVAGARSEDWRLYMVTAPGTAASQTITRRNPEVLWSGNVTLKFGERVNLRFAGFQGLTRPDPRELSTDRYAAVSAECATEGGPQSKRVKSNNGDVRFEVYPGLGELFAIGSFVKQFDAPLIERTSIGSGGDCTLQTFNAKSALAYGGEVELRKGLGFLGLKRWNLSTNATYTVSKIEFEQGAGLVQAGTGFVGLSPWLVNAILSFGDGSSPLDASLQYNWFSDRLVWYGVQRATATSAYNNFFERGRQTVDAKIRRRLGTRMTLSLSARNLTNAPMQQYVDLPDYGRINTRLWKIGTSYKMGVTYAF